MRKGVWLGVGAVGLAAAIVALARWQVKVNDPQRATALGGMFGVVKDAVVATATAVRDTVEAIAVKLKAGVNLNVTQPVMYALGVADAIYKRVAGKGVTVTSARDQHENRPQSLHNVGNAVDLRIRDLNAGQVSRVFTELKAALFPQGFDVVLESDHIHVEYDPKVGRQFIGGGSGVSA